MKNIFEIIGEVFTGKKLKLEGELLLEAEKLWDVKDGNWTPEQKKNFEQELKDYQDNAKAPTKEKYAFFEKLAASINDDPPTDPPTPSGDLNLKVKVFKYRANKNCVIEGVYRKEGEIVILGKETVIPHLELVLEPVEEN